VLAMKCLLVSAVMVAALGVAIGVSSANKPAAPPVNKPTGPAVGPDVPPELPARIYEQRRAELMKKLGGCTAVLRSFPAEGGSGNDFEPYFYYLTGIREHGSVLVLAPGEAITKTSLLLRPRDAEQEIWEGFREPMSARLRKRHRVDYVGRMRGPAPRNLTDALRRSRCYAYLRPAFARKDDVEHQLLGSYLKAFEARTVQRWQELEAMRATHDPEELLRMDKAVAITLEGHRVAVRKMAEGATERMVKGDIERVFYQAGATGLAFPSIVGSGPNGAILHWRSEDRRIEASDLVVVDIGASFGGYAADVTRTWPVSGRFSDEQRKVYEIVLAAQQKAIDAVRPGISLDALHRIGEEVIIAAGHELPHSIGHFVGLDVHDVGDRGGRLEPGMVITIEPGIYLPGKFGVRIEDMVLVTERGHKLMTAELPRSVDEVEAFVRASR
jgi:Xaa-Pro aminopeptidase